MKKSQIYNDWVQTLLNYNNELIDIIERKQSNADETIKTSINQLSEQKQIDVDNTVDNVIKQNDTIQAYAIAQTKNVCNKCRICFFIFVIFFFFCFISIYLLRCD